MKLTYYLSTLDNACYVNQSAQWIMSSRPTITVRLLPLQLAWLDAVAAVRKTNRSEVIREAVTWLAARESVRVERTRHYRVIQLIARQEAWNPVDDFLEEADEIERDRFDVS